MKLAWATSGAGKAARAIMEAHLIGLLKSKLDFVIFDRIGATQSMIQYCREKTIDYKIIAPENLESEFIKVQESNSFDSMGLTFNRIISQRVIDAFNGRVFNLHFSLLPMFPGFCPTRKALKSGLPYAGVTIHFVDAGVDTGPIIVQQKVEIKADDDESKLGRRQFEAAVPLLLQTVRLIETRKEVRFEQPDSDLVKFAAEYCVGV